MFGRTVILGVMLLTPLIPQTADRLKATTSVIQGADTAGRLWMDPSDIESRNLLYGSGGAEKRPRSNQFLFVKEDLEGSTTKFFVKDADGVEWKVKLGTEARPETVASRFVWAAGYFTRDYYLLPEIRVANLPHLHRGNQYVRDDGMVVGARLMRVKKNEKKIGQWTWRESPFLGTREFNGLRALMSLLNSWDLKDVNNAIYEEKEDQQAPGAAPELPLHRIYMMTDLGATFGTAGIVMGKPRSKGNLESYRESAFIESVLPDMVNFAAPARPTWLAMVRPGQYIDRTHMEWIGKQVPREDAAWMGQVLSRLSPAQIRDAFRAAGYSGEEMEGFAQVVEARIAALKALTRSIP